MTLREYWNILRRSWWVVLVTTLLGGLAGAGLSQLVTPMYQAQAQLFVSVQSSGGVNNAYTGGLYVQQRIESYVPVVDSPSVLDPVIQELQLGTTGTELADQVSVQNPTGTVLLNVQANDAAPEQAAKIADATAKSLANTIVSLETTSSGVKPVRVQVLRPAVVPTSPYSPRTQLNVVVGALVGFMVGFGIAVLRATLDTSIKSGEELHAVTGATLIGTVPSEATTAKNPLATSSGSLRGEAYRTLRTNLQYVDVDHPPKTVVITSCAPLEGKSTTAANLAIALANGGSNVLLVEADLRRPRVAEYLGLTASVGLTDVLTGRSDLAEAIVPWKRDLLHVLPAGSIPPNPSELLASQHLADILAELSARYDIVILDAPPLLPVTDAAILAATADGAILVARYGQTSREQAARGVEALEQVNARLFGVILNQVPAKRRSRHYDYGYAQKPAESGLSDQDGRAPSPDSTTA